MPGRLLFSKEKIEIDSTAWGMSAPREYPFFPVGTQVAFIIGKMELLPPFFMVL